MVSGADNQDFRTIPGLLPEGAGWSALDLGAGTGLYTAELARRGARVVAVEIDPQRLAAARAAQIAEVAWVRADATRLPFRSGAFDIILSVEVISHIDPVGQESCLGEVERLVAPNGRALITLHNSARLRLAQWLRLRKARTVYDTPGLKVWPTAAASAKRLARRCGLAVHGPVRYLNYHSRLSRQFCVNHPVWARWVKFVEDVLAKTPLLRRLSITFLLQLRPVKFDGPAHKVP